MSYIKLDAKPQKSFVVMNLNKFLLVWYKEPAEGEVNVHKQEADVFTPERFMSHSSEVWCCDRDSRQSGFRSLQNIHSFCYHPSGCTSYRSKSSAWFVFTAAPLWKVFVLAELMSPACSTSSRCQTETL